VAICTFWRLGFKQSSLYLIARVSRNAVPAPGHGYRFSGMLRSPEAFQLTG
jgi:hypothetical protein